MTSSAQLPILIIGAGPAGAFLAQIFRKANLPFRIFEREDKDYSRFQGWAVSLQWTIPVVESALSDDMGELRSCSVVGDHEIYRDAGFTNMDGDTGEAIMKASTANTIRCSRTKLKRYLAQHLDIEYDRHCVGYEYVQSQNGGPRKVVAKFSDGTTVEGSMIVAADGAHSHVREQLMNSLGPNVKQPQLQTPPKGVLSANTTLNATQWLSWEKMSPAVWVERSKHGGPIMIGGTIKLHKLPTDAKPDETIAEVYMIMVFDDEAAAAETTAESKERIQSYWTHSATQQELKDFAVEQCKPLASVFRQFVQEIPVKDFALKPILFTEFYCPSNLDGEGQTDGAQQRRVTLIGDACHPMLPLRGEGLNNALLDAATLGSLIVQASKKDAANGEWTTDSAVKSIFSHYEEEMIPRGWRAIELSRAAGVPGIDIMKHTGMLGGGERYWQKGLDLIESCRK